MVFLGHLLLLCRNTLCVCRKLRFLKTHFRNLFNKWPPCQETTVIQHDFNITYFTRQATWVGKRFFSFLDKSLQEAKIRLLHPVPELNVLILLRLCSQNVEIQNASSTIIYIILKCYQFFRLCKTGLTRR